jgi:DNA ligase 4
MTGCGYRYLTFARIGTGLSFADYEWINKKKWIAYDAENPPSWIMASSNPTPDDKGDVYLNPAE